ncbi:putative glycerophosphodiester phosphodiesterase, protein kinase RLK-Pelle-LRK10L-2 family [Lupinus albus]|uniref:Putative glycerophosphodiester phosphodiesterase, protein kinase RLK-Pelle-LRK10L-2 family n=2 Tax=Lupinus albus TaxID=3870 RepID=A0A6A4R328_LUPAL|nr:putative glycerophosphodiester phosphodiesterase, protein kinase RLK-Pelle-LRK10L-2 family [Lupinus albus]
MEIETSSSSLSLFASSIIFLLIIFQQICCDAKHHPPCPSSSCAKITNITSPFRLKSYPNHCGYKTLELDCEKNGTVLTFLSGKYYVNNINYSKYTMSLSDAGVVEDASCSFIPRYYLHTDFINIYGSFLVQIIQPSNHSYSTIAYLNCTNPVKDDRRYVKVDMSLSCGFGEHVYAVWDQWMDDSKSMMTKSDIRVGCGLMIATSTSKRLSGVELKGEISYGEIHKWMVEGFEVSWLGVICDQLCGTITCEIVNESNGEVKCFNYSKHCGWSYATSDNCGIVQQISDYIRAYLSGVIIGIYRRFSTKDDLGKPFQYFTDGGIFMGQYILPSLIAIRYSFGVVLMLILLIYKWRRRHLSMYEEIENFLLDNNLSPIRYEYKEIKKMSGSFKVKLGQGGYGSVYKGKLRSGPDVAIKMLNNKFNSNGQDFINEVATIGRIHHVNVVRLVGYCVDGTKRALVYEFMPNGSLDKYIFSNEGIVSLSYEKIYEISLGIAHGISYLHQGCDMQILHFDIKPHNILLDENFIPKVSDFGLAKLYPVDDSIVTLTGVRGTLGYMAPELFYRNVGGVSYKVDVYSFGMLLMEMTSKRKNSNPNAEHSSQVYFPFWIYDKFNEEKDIEMEDLCEEEDRNVAKKMFIVALWCIQLKPSDRPSMTKVVEMLEGDIESLQMPPKPSFYPHDDEINTDQTSWTDSYSSNSYMQSHN